MRKTLLAFDKIPQFAKTDVAYATGDVRLKPFYQYEPSVAQLAEALRVKSEGRFPRAEIVSVLQAHYAGLPEAPAVTAHIDALALETTFTVVTAHQPSLFLGPLYFLYKAITTINLAEMAQAATGHTVVPVFVLGSEDHDLDELNKINLFNKKIVWDSTESGAVGSMSTAGLAPVLAELKSMLGESEAAQQLFARVERAYTEQPTLAAATRAMLHELFGRFGLVVFDMNHPVLKRHFIPVLKSELLEQVAAHKVGETIARLNELGFKTQATPRDINLFYMRPGLRERIVLEDGVYKVLHTDIQFTREEILREVEAHPEHFSPNVVLRPLYQEIILPNLAYVGGGGELAYWLERKSLFAYYQVPLPMLVRRSSALWVDRDSVKKLVKFNFSVTRLFEDIDTLLRAYVAANAEAEVSLRDEVDGLQQLFERIARKATVIDPTLEKAVRADAVKAVGNMEQWESRLVRAEKQKHEVTLNQIRALREKLLPGNGMQERSDNFMPYLLKYGETWIDTLKATLLPFEPGLVLLEDLGEPQQG